MDFKTMEVNDTKHPEVENEIIKTSYYDIKPMHHRRCSTKITRKNLHIIS